MTALQVSLADLHMPGCQSIIMAFAAEIDLLRRHIDQLQVIAYDGRKFVPQTALRDYFTRERIKKFLDLYCIPRHIAGAIHSNYLAVFVILLLNGNALYINSFLRYDYLSDAYLPFRSCAAWPESCLDLYTNFEKVQWAYCAQKLRFDRLEDMRFDPKIIIPITSRKDLEAGSNTKKYRIEIHPDYNLLETEVNLLANYSKKTDK